MDQTRTLSIRISRTCARHLQGHIVALTPPRISTTILVLALVLVLALFGYSSELKSGGHKTTAQTATEGARSYIMTWVPVLLGKEYPFLQ